MINKLMKQIPLFSPRYNITKYLIKKTKKYIKTIKCKLCVVVSTSYQIINKAALVE